MTPKCKTVDQLKRPELKGDFECATCLQRFTHMASLTRHRQYCGQHTCNLCDLKIGNAGELRLHMNLVHQISTIFTCNCCGFTFERMEILREHQKQLELTGTAGTTRILATAGNAPGSLRQKKDAGRTSLSPSSTVYSLASSSNKTSRQTTPTPEIVDVPAPDMAVGTVENVQSEYDKLMNEAMEKLLDSKTFTGDELVVPDNWFKMIEVAHKVVTKKMNAVKKMNTTQSGNRRKRARVD